LPLISELVLNPAAAEPMLREEDPAVRNLNIICAILLTALLTGASPADAQSPTTAQSVPKGGHPLYKAGDRMDDGHGHMSTVAYVHASGMVAVVDDYSACAGDLIADGKVPAGLHFPSAPARGSIGSRSTLTRPTFTPAGPPAKCGYSKTAFADKPPIILRDSDFTTKPGYPKYPVYASAGQNDNAAGAEDVEVQAAQAGQQWRLYTGPNAAGNANINADGVFVRFFNGQPPTVSGDQFQYSWIGGDIYSAC
jgi:hypothetical protein